MSSSDSQDGFEKSGVTNSEMGDHVGEMPLRIKEIQDRSHNIDVVTEMNQFIIGELNIAGGIPRGSSVALASTKDGQLVVLLSRRLWQGGLSPRQGTLIKDPSNLAIRQAVEPLDIVDSILSKQIVPLEGGYIEQ